MFTTTLRTVGGSVMFAIPKSILDGLGLHANQQIGVSIADGRMIVEPKLKPRYTMAELLSQSNFDLPITDDEREWLDAPPVGNEVI